MFLQNRLDTFKLSTYYIESLGPSFPSDLNHGLIIYLQTSNSPVKNCLSNSAFSPTYDEIIRFTCLLFNKTPRPKSSTPGTCVNYSDM